MEKKKEKKKKKKHDRTEYSLKSFLTLVSSPHCVIQSVYCHLVFFLYPPTVPFLVDSRKKGTVGGYGL